ARFSEPERLLDAEAQALEKMAEALRGSGYTNLAGLVALRPRQGDALLVVAVRYFFRRAIEEDAALFHGLAFAKLEGLQEAQEQAFAGLNQLLREQGQRLDQVLAGVEEKVTATHGAVLDIQEEQYRQGDQNREIYSAVLQLQGRFDMLQRELR